MDAPAEPTAVTREPEPAALPADAAPAALPPAALPVDPLQDAPAVGDPLAGAEPPQVVVVVVIVVVDDAGGGVVVTGVMGGGVVVVEVVVVVVVVDPAGGVVVVEGGVVIVDPAGGVVVVGGGVVVVVVVVVVSSSSSSYQQRGRASTWTCHSRQRRPIAVRYPPTPLNTAGRTEPKERQRLRARRSTIYASSEPHPFPRETFVVCTRRCPAESTATNFRTSLAPPSPMSRRAGKRRKMSVYGLGISDSVS